jgi:hypothetical protein
VASAMAGSVYIPMAKALDLWGRAEGFLVMITFCVLGLVLLASSKNLETYCAGQVRWTPLPQFSKSVENQREVF